MDGLSFKDQLQLYYKADIVVSPHSASFINLIFSVPHTVVVECFPPYFFEMWYSNTAMISRLHYIMVSSFAEKEPTRMGSFFWFEDIILITKSILLSSKCSLLYGMLLNIQNGGGLCMKWMISGLQFLFNGGNPSVVVYESIAKCLFCKIKRLSWIVFVIHIPYYTSHRADNWLGG